MAMTNVSTGKPDFLQNPPSNPTSPVFDLGEEANHNLLGGGGQSRSGRWYWASGFETGSAKEVLVGGAGTIVGNSLGVWQGQYALQMQTQAVPADVSSVFKYFLSQNSPSGRWGIEAMIALGTRDTFFDVSLTAASPTGIHSSTLRINIPAAAANLVFQYLDNAGVYQNIATPTNGVNQQGANFALSTQVYHNIKLVVDFSTFYYVRAIIDGVTYDLSAIPMLPGAAGADVRQVWRMSYTTNGAVVASAVVDNIIFTADEP
jgi:hypothetical protein